MEDTGAGCLVRFHAQERREPRLLRHRADFCCDRQARLVPLDGRDRVRGVLAPDALGNQTFRHNSCLKEKMGRAPTLVLCSRNARPEKGLVRRPHLDQQGALPKGNNERAWREHVDRPMRAVKGNLGHSLAEGVEIKIQSPMTCLFFSHRGSLA